MKKSKQGFSPIVILIIIAVVVAGGAYLYMHNKQKDAVPVESNTDTGVSADVVKSDTVATSSVSGINWSGTYNFTELSPALPNSGQSTKIEAYKLSMKKDGATRDYNIEIEISGSQGSQKMKAFGIMSATKLEVTFDSYLSSSGTKIYQKGDALFNLSLDSKTKLKITWGKMRPMFSKTDINKSYFTKLK
jgi:hypothetical protein